MAGKFTDELFDKICERISTSRDGLNHICKENNINASNFFRWITSDEEKIINNIKENKIKIEENKEIINTKEKENDYRHKVLLCLKSQLDRLINWLEYRIDYCDNEANLSNFAGLE